MSSLEELLNSIFRDAETGLFDFIQKIENGLFDICEFENENLFMNIFYCFNFIKFLSPYYHQYDKLIFKLKCNIRKKWLKDLPNVNYVIRLIQRQSKEIDPNGYFLNSEDYFIKLLFLKLISDVLYFDEEKKRKRRKNKKILLLR